MLNIDFHFTYKNALRFIILSKLGDLRYKNTYATPYLKKINLFFSLSKVTDKDIISLYNYFYLFKFFFGKNAFLSKYKSFYNLGVWSYNFKVFLPFTKKDVYYIIYYLINEFIFYIDKFNYGLYSNKLNIIYLILKDFSIFSEKKTNLGLFNLQDPLNIHLYFNGLSDNDSKIILRNFKIKTKW